MVQCKLHSNVSHRLVHLIRLMIVMGASVAKCVFLENFNYACARVYAVKEAYCTFKMIVARRGSHDGVTMRIVLLELK